MKDIFITENFLLQNATAVRLYREYTKDLPIIDYHCHLPAQQVAEDHRFRNLAEIWLTGDHYKWRLMRANGVPERLITGDASDWEKFHTWAETVPKTLRNPIYQWTHMEIEAPVRHLRPAPRPRHGEEHLGRVQREAGDAPSSRPAASSAR